MIAPNYNKLCSQAERHYFNMLPDKAENQVPADVIDHIRGCLYCREQITRLEAMLAECRAPHRIGHNMAVTALLKLHFSFVGKPVNCSDVKPFLPALLAAPAQIRIPTPITAHIDNCDRCKEDYANLKKIGLSAKQLITLSQMFADEFDDEKIDCASAQKAIPAVVAMAFDHTDAETLRHLSLCVECREEIFRFRQASLKQSESRQDKRENGNTKSICSSIGPADIFDYCVPYGIDPAGDEYIKFRKSLTSHIVCCPDCLDKIQQLHKTVYGIAERADSGIITVFHVDKAAETQPVVENENPYAGFPVRVEIAPQNAVEESYEEKEIIPKPRPAVIKLKPLLKYALPAAALIKLV
jgi:hypothetical protein